MGTGNLPRICLHNNTLYLYVYVFYSYALFIGNCSRIILMSPSFSVIVIQKECTRIHVNSEKKKKICNSDLQYTHLSNIALEYRLWLLRTIAFREHVSSVIPSDVRPLYFLKNRRPVVKVHTNTFFFFLVI